MIDTPITDPMLNSTFGAYYVQQGLGAGGMAAVYRAKDSRDQKTVALKVLHSNWVADPDVVKRFYREVEIVNHLDHMAIVPIYDYGMIDGRPYLTMRYMAGGTLQHLYVEPHSVAMNEGVRILRRVAAALDYAHLQGVIHRDLKLENILLDERGEAYLSDFGIARVSGVSGITATGNIMGTPQYMAPELIRGDEDLGQSVDLYALAVIGYLLAVGRFPFVANNPIMVLNQHLSELPPVPSEINPQVPPALDVVLLKGLEKEPEKRFRSADAFVESYVKAFASLDNRSTVVDIRPDARLTPLPKKPDGPSADEWYEKARTAETPEDVIRFLRKALEVDPWHNKANRALLRLEGAKSLKASESADKPPSSVSRVPRIDKGLAQRPLPSIERKVKPTANTPRRMDTRQLRLGVGVVVSLLMFVLSLAMNLTYYFGQSVGVGLQCAGLAFSALLGLATIGIYFEWW